MKIDEKLELLARAIRGEVKIEVYGRVSNSWYQLEYNSRCFESKYDDWYIDDIIATNIREVKKLPLLTQDECEFLKFYPQDWWIAKDRSGLIYIFSKKPSKDEEEWCDHEWNGHKRIDDHISLKFDGIQWSDEDCYTIGELIAYAKENK